MADVQPEHGYTKLADEILEQMAKTKLSPTQYRILFVVWRFTYGFNRKEHDLTLGFISKATGCDKRQLQRDLKGLEERRVIFQKVVNGKGRKIMFNKNYDDWLERQTIGETTIGETVNGEIDNGQTINAGIGETVNGTIGETVNQEIHSLQTNLQTTDTTAALTFDPFIQVINEFCDLHQKGDWQMKEKERTAIKELLQSGIPPFFITSTMKKIHKHKTAQGERITSFAYYFEQIKETWKVGENSEKPSGLQHERGLPEDKPITGGQVGWLPSKYNKGDNVVQLPNVSG